MNRKSRSSATEIVDVKLVNGTLADDDHAKLDLAEDSNKFWRKIDVSYKRYELLSPIGVGGMGTVYSGVDTLLKRKIAIKLMNKSDAGNSKRLSRFMQEILIHSQLQHPGIPQLLDVGKLHDGTPFLVMEFCKGKLLTDILDERKNPMEQFPNTFELFYQVCQTITYAQSKGVCHRDLKPQNVIVDRENQAHVIDWGLATLQSRILSTELNQFGTEEIQVDTLYDTAEGEALGSALYIPPEQANGNTKACQFKRDVFGLGAILCVLLTGKPPYQGTTSGVWSKAKLGDMTETFDRLKQSNAPAPLTMLAINCLAANPNNRPENAEEILKAVKEFRRSMLQRELLRKKTPEKKAKKGGIFNSLRARLRNSKED